MSSSKILRFLPHPHLQGCYISLFTRLACVCVCVCELVDSLIVFSLLSSWLVCFIGCLLCLVQVRADGLWNLSRYGRKATVREFYGKVSSFSA